MKNKMKVVVIYSKPGKGSTYNCVQIFKGALQEENEVDFVEFTLPEDMPHVCLGCFTCFEKGEDKCPHADRVQPIINEILSADGIILSSPVYAMDASGAMKSLFDHMCYLWISHRPNEEMFHKIAMVISTAAGTGIKASVGTLKKSLRYWGVKRTYSFGAALRASRWEDVSDKARGKITAKLNQKAKKFGNDILNRDRLRPPMLIRFLFPLMGKMIGGYEAGSLLDRDTRYWKEKGWLDGGKPF